MKIRTERAALADTLGWVTRVIGRGPSTPALAGVRLTATEAGLTAYAFDYETSHAADIEAEVVTPGECLVPGFFLRDAVTGGRGKDVELVLDEGTLTVTSGRSTYRLRVLDLGDYPSLPDFPAEVGSIGAGQIEASVNAVSVAADDSSPVPALRALRLEAENGVLAMAATDRFRLHAREVTWQGDDFEATVSAKTVVAALKGMAGQITFGSDDRNLLGIRDEHRRVTIRVFDEDYLKWRSVPESAEKTAKGRLTVDGDDLLAAVKQVGALLPDPNTSVQLIFENGELTVTTGGQSEGEGTEVLAAQSDSVPMRLGVTPKYLALALGATSGGPLDLRYGTQPERNTPLLIEDPKRPGLTLLVMPRRASGSN